MTRRPNKPHRDGYEDEEDCEGHYDPNEADRRRCHPSWTRSQDDPCHICFEQWFAREEAKRQAKWDTKTSKEQAKREAHIKGLRELY